MDVLTEMAMRITELARRVRNIIRYADVTEVDPAKGLVKVVDKGGGEGKDLHSPWRPWAEVGAPRSAGNGTTWRPPTKGQRVMWISPSGNPGEGIIMAAAFSNECAAPSQSGDEHVETIGNAKTTMKDGSHKLEVGGAIVEVTPGKIKLKCGEIEIEGHVTVKGNMDQQGVHTDSNGLHG